MLYLECKKDKSNIIYKLFKLSNDVYTLINIKMSVCFDWICDSKNINRYYHLINPLYNLIVYLDLLKMKNLNIDSSFSNMLIEFIVLLSRKYYFIYIDFILHYYNIFHQI